VRGYRKSAQGGLSIPTHKLVDEGTHHAVPYGSKLSFVQDKDGREEELANGLWIRVSVRDGRPQLVAIESRATEYPLSSSRLRFALDDAVKEIIQLYTVRLAYDSKGEPYGIWADSPTGAGEIRSVAERTRDVTDSARPKRGRPRLTDEFLTEVARRWHDERKQGRAAAAALAKTYSVEESTVRQWMFKARERELVQKEENDG